jgi:hypothetical protein
VTASPSASALPGSPSTCAARRSTAPARSFSVEEPGGFSFDRRRTTPCKLRSAGANYQDQHVHVPGVRRSSSVSGEACYVRYCPIAGGRQCRAHGRRNARPGRDRSAATSLSVTLSASGTAASAVWDTAGDPVLTVGTPSDTTYAKITINSPPAVAPATAPTFTTNYDDAGSPHWVIQFADGDSLVGYPSNADLGDANWSVVPASSGACSDLTHTPQHDTYVNVVAFVQNAGCGGNLTGAAIVADGNQAAETSDTITDIVYDGETLVSGPDTMTVTNPGAETGTVGMTISALDIAASSNKGDRIASYAATGLPAGLSVDTSTGAITGTPPRLVPTTSRFPGPTTAVRLAPRPSPGRSRPRRARPTSPRSCPARAPSRARAPASAR